MTPAELKEKIQQQKEVVEQMRRDYANHPSEQFVVQLRREEEEYRRLLRLQVGDKREKHERTSRTTWD